MSLVGKIAKVAARVVKKAAPIASLAPGPVGIAARGIVAAGTIGGGAVAAARAAGLAGGGLARALPQLPSMAGRVMPGVGAMTRAGALGKVGRVASGAATAYFVYDAFGNLVGTKKKSRRMNMCNGKALSRAMRRVNGAVKLCKKVDKLTHYRPHRRAASTR
jgi:hypothetical protein